MFGSNHGSNRSRAYCGIVASNQLLAGHRGATLALLEKETRHRKGPLKDSALGRITGPPPKPKPKYLHDVRVGHRGQWSARQADLWAAVTRVAGTADFQKRDPFWASTVISFDTAEKAAALRRWLRNCHFDQEADRPSSDPYAAVVKAQHAVIWVLTTGIIREVVRTYRTYRSDCSTHGMPKWEAASVILRAAPSITREDAREMVEAMLALVIARHGAWFWSGLKATTSPIGTEEIEGQSPTSSPG